MEAPTDGEPLHDVQAQQVSEDKDQWFVIALISIILIIVGFGIFLAAYWAQLSPGLNRDILLGLNATIVVLILACAYFFAWRFFDDLFYLFVSIAWFANACYLPFEFLFDNQCEKNASACFRFAVYTFLLSVLSSIPLYLSTLTKPRSKQVLPTGWASLFWILGSIAFTSGSYLYLTYVRPSSLALVFATGTIPGVLFTTYSLF